MFDKSFRYETTYEGLWKYEKKTFRPTFIATIFSFFIVFLAFLSFGTVLMIFMNSILDYAQSKSVDQTKIKYEIIGKMAMNFGVALYAAVMIIFISIAIARGYKEKNFTRLPLWPIYSYLFISILLLWRFISAFIDLRRGNVASTSDEKVALFLQLTATLTSVFSILIITFYFLFVKRFAIIRAVYFNIKRIKELENLTPGIREFLSNLQNELMKDRKKENDSKDAEEEKELTQTPDEIKQSKREKHFKKLVDLPNEKLFNIAKQLYISGYDEMPKEELAILILDILDQQQFNKQNEEKEEIVESKPAEKTKPKAKKEGTISDENNTTKSNKKDEKEIIVEPKDPEK